MSDDTPSPLNNVITIDDERHSGVALFLQGVRSSQRFTPPVMPRERQEFGITSVDDPEDFFCWRMSANYAPEVRPKLCDDAPASAPDVHKTLANIEKWFDICHPHRSDHDVGSTKTS